MTSTFDEFERLPVLGSRSSTIPSGMVHIVLPPLLPARRVHITCEAPTSIGAGILPGCSEGSLGLDAALINSRSSGVMWVLA